MDKLTIFPLKQSHYNKETCLAMQEARDIIDGKIQAKQYTSLDEALTDLHTN